MPSEEEVELTVADTGSGVPEELQETLFEPFRTSKDLFQELDISIGTLGLGLTSVYHLLDSVGGSIELAENSKKDPQTKIKDFI